MYLYTFNTWTVFIFKCCQSHELCLLFKESTNSMWCTLFFFPAQLLVFPRADNSLEFLLVYLSMYLSLIWFQRLC